MQKKQQCKNPTERTALAFGMNISCFQTIGMFQAEGKILFERSSIALDLHATVHKAQAFLWTQL